MRGITDDFEAIIITSYGDESSAIQAMRDGAVNFIKKPISLDQMILAVKKALEKLDSDRSLKYRTRELELARQIIAKITADRRLIIDVRSHTRKAARDFAQNLLDAMPLGIVVLDKDMTIRYVNRHLAEAIGSQAQRVDEEFVQKLRKIGIKELSYESLMSTIKKVFESPKGTLEKVSVSRYAYLTLTTITILQEEKEEDVVLMAMRGERH